jgi:type I restriction enzyme, S subunit
MNADRLLAQYEQIADAPDAIARLRRFILDLAVRGKLVPQEARDEPASELLKRIAKEKARLVNAGEIRKPPILEPIADPEALCALPMTWAWARVGDIFDYDAGTKRDPKELDQSRWLLELEDIEKDTSRIVERLRVSDRDSQSTKSEFRLGDILYGKLRPYLNKVVVADEPGYSTTEIVAIRSFLPLCPEYCALAFRRPDFVAYVERLGRGTKMPRLRTPDAIVAPFPLPPLPEQHRIVAKVDELIGLCDRLEAAQAGREGVRDRLAAASLARLNAPEPDTFQADARFALDALTALTTRPDQIKALRQTILNLAVRGKLVPREPTDEQASELLQRIAKERAELVKRKEIRREEPLDPIRPSEMPFDVPATWIWTRIGEAVLFTQYGTIAESEPFGERGAYSHNGKYP